MITPQVIHLGFIMLPWSFVIVLLSLIIAIMISKTFFHRTANSLTDWKGFKDQLWTSILITLIAARLSFVILNNDIYLADPVQIFKIQDKGFAVFSGFIVAALWLVWKNHQPHLRKTALIFIFSLAALYTGGQWTLNQFQAQYQQFPALELQGINNQTYELKKFYGKPVVINLWASWCPPCHREMPVLAQAQQNYPDVQFIMINQGEPSDVISAYLAKNKLSFQHMLLDPHGETAAETGMYGLPSTLFFNAQGQLVETHMGELSTAVLRQKIAAINKHQGN